MQLEMKDEEGESIQTLRYYFICKNMSNQSFWMDIAKSDLEKTVGWLAAKAKCQYDNEQSEYQVETNIENVFDNLGYFDYQQSLQDTIISKVYYFTATARHEGLQIRYSFQKHSKKQIGSLIVNKDAKVGDLRNAIAKALQINEKQMELHHIAKQLKDDEILVTDIVGIKESDSNHNIIRVVLLIEISLIPCQSYEVIQFNAYLKQKIYLNPFQNLKAQIAEIQKIGQNSFILLDKQNQVIEQIEEVKEQDIVVLRDINKGQKDLHLILIDQEDLAEQLLTEDIPSIDNFITVQVYNDDPLDLILKITSLKHQIPYLAAFAYLDMNLIKGKTKFKDLQFLTGEQQLYAVCAYHGEIAIVNSNKQVIPLKIDFKETVFGLKNILENKIGIDSLDQLMYFSGFLLEDSKTLVDYKICVGSRISVEENIFKESLKNKNRQEYSNSEYSKSHSMNLLYKINQTENRRITNSADTDGANMLGEGLNLICTCTNSFCRNNYGDGEMIYLKGLGNHLLTLNNDSILVNQNCKRCLSPVKMQSIVFKDCSVIYIKQTKNERSFNFKWQFFSALNINEFKLLSTESQSIYFYVRDNLQNSIEKDQYLSNCLICRQNLILSNEIQQFIHPECKQQFSLNVNEVFSIVEE